MDQQQHRQSVYQKMFGKKFHCVLNGSPDNPVDVLQFDPVRKRDFYTLVTNGLSDFRMQVPQGHPICRVELGAYLDEPIPAVPEMLQWLSRIVQTGGEWIGPGSTMTNGMPSQVLIEDTELDCFGFFQPLIEPDFELPSRLEIDGDCVCLLWVVPITSAEREFLKQHKVEEFYTLMENAGHALSFNAPRVSYV